MCVCVSNSYYISYVCQLHTDFKILLLQKLKWSKLKPNITSFLRKWSKKQSQIVVDAIWCLQNDVIYILAHHSKCSCLDIKVLINFKNLTPKQAFERPYLDLDTHICCHKHVFELPTYFQYEQIMSKENLYEIELIQQIHFSKLFDTFMSLKIQVQIHNLMSLNTKIYI